MNANERESFEVLLEDVVGAAYEVANTRGCGFLEKVYERALAKELILRGRAVAQQTSYSVMYKRALVGEYLADLILDESLILELKC
jgi:GxxExxY protein